MTLRHGISYPDYASDIEIELDCFRRRRTRAQGGLDPYGHFRNICQMLWPELQWHQWLQDRIKGLCEFSTSSWVGCATAGKTFDAGLFSMVFWLADPSETSVILTSTTGKMVRKRIWPVIQKLYSRGGQYGLPGNLVDSKTTLQSTKGDDKHGIFALAVRDGNTSKAVGDIQGLHAKRILLVIDEATDTPEAIFEAIPNLRKGCADFRLVVIGNAVSHLDPHGLCCEPRNGWSSVSVEDEDWETKGVDKWEIESGICLHFDGLKSPNYRFQKPLYEYLISKEDVDRAIKTQGGEDTLGFWKYTRGFWAPEGVCKTVLSDALIAKYNARGKLIFQSNFRKISVLDPAFGGDRCVQRIGQLGDLSGNRLGIQINEAIEIKLRPQDKEPIHFQIARQVRHNCERAGVEPKHFALDASGEGGGLADILAATWSDQIQRVEFGGAPSDMPTSEQDPRPASEVYDRKVTELWFSVRQFVMGQQIGGLTVIDCQELTSRQYTDEKRKIKLDTKADCKKKIGRSPDYGDSVALAVELARRLGASAGTAGPTNSSRDWLAKAKEYASIYDSDESSEYKGDSEYLEVV